MAALEDYLRLDRCPYCSIDNPNLLALNESFVTKDDRDENPRLWRTYKCRRCGGVILGYANYNRKYNNYGFSGIYPSGQSVNPILPNRVKAYIQQAIDSTAAPSGAVMLCASAVDEMLKVKNYIQGSLYSRIEKATEEKLLTPDMATWAHQVRLDANDQRHADVNGGMPTIEDAKLVIEFTKTLAEFLFVLPAKVTRGIANSSQPIQNESASPQPSGLPIDKGQ